MGFMDVGALTTALFNTKNAQEANTRAWEEQKMMNQLRNEQLLISQKARERDKQWQQMTAHQPYMTPDSKRTPLGEQRFQGLMQGVPQELSGFGGEGIVAPNPEYATRQAQAMEYLKQRGGEAREPSIKEIVSMLAPEHAATFIASRESKEAALARQQYEDLLRHQDRKDTLTQRAYDNEQNRQQRKDLNAAILASKQGGGKRAEFKDEMALRKEFHGLEEVKNYVTVQSQGLRARAALTESLKNNSNMPVDQTVITTFNKMLDPSSVVRESEYARTPQDLGLLSKIKGKWDKVQNGGAGLDLNERQALVRMIDNFSNIAETQYNDQVAQYTEIAKKNGFDPAYVIRLGTKKETTTPQTPSGTPRFKIIQ